MSKNKLLPDYLTFTESDKKGGKGRMFGSETENFNSKSTYIIPLMEILCRIKDDDPDTKTFKFSSDFVRIKKNGKMELEYHKDVRARYIVCVVKKGLEFSRLKKRGFDVVDLGNKEAYFIPLKFLRSSVPSDISFFDSLSNVITNVSVFKYSGEFDFLQETSIFNLADKIYLARKTDDSDFIRVTV